MAEPLHHFLPADDMRLLRIPVHIEQDLRQQGHSGIPAPLLLLPAQGEQVKLEKRERPKLTVT
jgi:hypothetical protein